MAPAGKTTTAPTGPSDARAHSRSPALVLSQHVRTTLVAAARSPAAPSRLWFEDEATYWKSIDRDNHGARTDVLVADRGEEAAEAPSSPRP